jgi:hypothetical protein
VLAERRHCWLGEAGRLRSVSRCRPRCSPATDAPTFNPCHSRAVSLRRAAWPKALIFAGCVWCCRISRDESRTGEARGSVASSRVPSPATAPRDERESVAGQRPPADALNLWVLSRPKGELVPYGVEGSEQPIERTADQPKPTVLVVLGVGEAPACAQWYGQRAIDALAAGIAPLRVVASVLDSGRRWRWGDTASTVSGMIRSSEGAFGGAQAAKSESFSAWVLEAAAARHVLIDGRNLRAVSSAPPGRSSEHLASIPPCAVATAPALSGPLGILIRTAGGEFFGGVIGRDLAADAGVVSVMTEYGVALSVGPKGGVLMISDCSLLPPDRVAERIYASPNWASSTAEPNEPGSCGIGHALLTAERAWVTTGSPLSWAASDMEGVPARAAPVTLKGTADAGADGAGATVPQ